MLLEIVPRNVIQYYGYATFYRENESTITQCTITLYKEICVSVLISAWYAMTALWKWQCQAWDNNPFFGKL